MKVFLACRNGFNSYYIASHLARVNLLDGVIVESGLVARKRKMARIKKKTRIWQYPLVFFDLAALTVYQKLLNRSMRRYIVDVLGINSFPEHIPLFHIDDINEEKCKAILHREKPDLLVILGTGILKEDVISIPNQYVFNIHGGIVPEYRNVHSELWAYIKKDYENIGTTIIYLDAGIDTGDIALQATISTNQCDSIFEIKRKNVILAADLIQQVLASDPSHLSRTPQEKAKQKFYPTPKTRQFLSLIFISLVNRVKCLKLSS